MDRGENTLASPTTIANPMRTPLIVVAVAMLVALAVIFAATAPAFSSGTLAFLAAFYAIVGLAIAWFLLRIARARLEACGDGTVVLRRAYGRHEEFRASAARAVTTGPMTGIAATVVPRDFLQIVIELADGPPIGVDFLAAREPDRLERWCAQVSAALNLSDDVPL